MKTILVTVSDDRMGRKGGIYEKTQQRIYGLLQGTGLIDIFYMPTWKDIIQTTFYENNKLLLDHVDPAKNGRAYKPFAISEAFKKADNGDLIIYQDCSPEMWSCSVIPNNISIGNLYKKVEQCNGILAPFVRWDTRPMLTSEDKGIHTHRNFTTSICIEAMGAKEYTNNYMCASGFVCFIKNSETQAFIDIWLAYNTIDLCCALGRKEDPNDYSFWGDYEDRYKMGHRHDQSILGLLMNKWQPFLIEHITGDHHVYNFLNYCTKHNAKFVNSNKGPYTLNRINKGDEVKNKAGVILRVFEVWPEGDKEVYIIGMHRESTFKAYEHELSLAL